MDLIIKVGPSKVCHTGTQSHMFGLMLFGSAGLSPCRWHWAIESHPCSRHVHCGRAW
jgi:hypothetical protein